MPRNNDLFRKLALATVVALGISTAWGMLTIWTFSIVESVSYRQRPYEQILVGTSGQPFVFRYRNGIYSAQQEVLDLDGEPAQADSRSLLYPMYVSRQLNSGAGRQSRLAGVTDGGMPANYWYLVHDGTAAGRAYGIGYHSLTKQVVGYFSRKGFADRLPPREEWFEIAGNSGLTFATPQVQFFEPQATESRLFFLSEGRLWAVNVAARQIEQLGDAPLDATLAWAWNLEKVPERPPQEVNSAGSWAPKELVIRANEFCTLVDPQTGTQMTYPLPVEVRKNMFACCHLPDGNLLLLASHSGPSRTSQRVMWIDPNGEVLRNQELQLAQLGLPSGGEAGFAWASAVTAPFVVGQIPVMILAPTSIVDAGQADTYWEAVEILLQYCWPAFLVVLTLSAIPATAAYQRQKHFGLPAPLGWAAFVLLFGLPGWISYRLHRTWPVLEECPACRQSAPRDRDACIECGAEFSPPPLKGIEVFA